MGRREVNRKAQPGGLRFGTAGVPHSAKASNPAAGVEAVAALGLGAMELEFVYGVRINDKMAELTRHKALELDIALTCHGPYYINLNSQEAAKRKASRVRILDTARAAHKVGARSITFHAAFYMKQEPARVHQVVKKSLEEIVDTLRAEGIQDVQIRPELTGKPSQYGDLGELLQLACEIEGVSPCIDFSHLYARYAGEKNRLEDFLETLQRYQATLGKAALQDLHLHVSGIEYTPKGERRHLDLDDSEFNYRGLLKALKQVKAQGVLICESPVPEDDALKLKRSYARIRAKGG